MCSVDGTSGSGVDFDGSPRSSGAVSCVVCCVRSFQSSTPKSSVRTSHSEL